MWLDKLRDLKKKTGTTNKYLAEKMHRSERTIGRYFSGEADIGIDELRDLVNLMNGSLDEVFDESDFKLPTPEIEALKNEIASLLSKIEELTLNENALKAEIVMHKDEICSLKVENERLRLTLAHKEEIISLHNYYNKLKSNT